MDKYIVISDLHGDLTSAKKVQSLAKANPDLKILCLGDVLYHGPRNDFPKDYHPKEVFPILNTLKDRIIAVRGNCDAEVDQMVLEFPIMADDDTIPLGKRNIHMSHGHVYSPDQLPSMNEEDVFLSGHTHIPTANYKDNIYLCNPGSMTLPKEDHPRSYAIIDENAFTIYALDDTVYMQVEFK